MEFQFKIKDKVQVVPLSANGTVTALFVCEEWYAIQSKIFL
jgi:hypothetical protein